MSDALVTRAKSGDAMDSVAWPADGLACGTSDIDFRLPENELHLWSVPLTGAAATNQHLFETLTEDEQQRAARFHFERDRKRFVIARGILRTILARYLSAEPGELRFAYGPQGKPRLAGDVPSLEFNLAHSADLAVYAFGRDVRLGVDVEMLRPMADAEALARRFFSPAEFAELMGLESEQRNQAFFAAWTRKEALLKAVGDGLSLGLDRFRVSLLPGAPAELLEGGPDFAGRWTLYHLLPAAGFVGALAHAKAPQRLQLVNCDSAESCAQALTAGSAPERTCA